MILGVPGYNLVMAEFLIREWDLGGVFMVYVFLIVGVFGCDFLMFNMSVEVFVGTMVLSGVLLRLVSDFGIVVTSLCSFVQVQVKRTNFSFGPKQNTKLTFDHPPPPPPPKFFKKVRGKLKV